MAAGVSSSAPSTMPRASAPIGAGNPAPRPAPPFGAPCRGLPSGLRGDAPWPPPDRHGAPCGHPRGADRRRSRNDHRRRTDAQAGRSHAPRLRPARARAKFRGTAPAPVPRRAPSDLPLPTGMPSPPRAAGARRARSARGERRIRPAAPRVQPRGPAWTRRSRRGAPNRQTPPRARSGQPDHGERRARRLSVAIAAATQAATNTAASTWPASPNPQASAARAACLGWRPMVSESRAHTRPLIHGAGYPE